MVAVKEKIESLEHDIEEFRLERNIPADTQISPETFLKLKYPNEAERAD